MGNHRSAGSFCSLVVSTTTGASDSVASLLAVTFGDGAEVYCIANAAVYRMNATSTQANDGDTFIKPNSGLGCWVKQGAESSYTQVLTGTANFTGAAIGALVVDTWKALPSVVGAYAASFASAMWSISTTTGVVTYSGVSGLQFAFHVTLSVSSNNAGSIILFESTLSKNGALIGTTTDDASAQRNTLTGFAGAPVEFSFNPVVRPVANDTFQTILRSFTSGVAASATARYQVLITQV